MRGVDHDRDEQFVAHARSDSVRVLEERVGNWNYYNSQDDKPTNLDDHYGIRRSRGFGGGLGKIVLEAPDDVLDRLIAVVDADGDWLRRNADRENGEQSTKWTVPHFRPADAPERSGGYAYDEDSPESATQTPDGVVVVQTRAYADDDGPQPVAGRSLSARRLDWLFDLLEEVALADPKKIDPYIATVGVTVQYEDLIDATGNGLSSQGSTLTGEAVRRLCCDAGIHRIVVKGQSEILDYGREERLFNRTLRRAIRFRHGHSCAVRGCGRRITHIHHVRWWEHDGETCIDNGIPLCSYHHHLVHEGGWNVVWKPTTGIVTVEGPRGQILETTASFLSAA